MVFEEVYSYNIRSTVDDESSLLLVEIILLEEDHDKALEGWPCNRESFSEFNRQSRNFQHSLSLLSSLGM